VNPQAYCRAQRERTRTACLADDPSATAAKRRKVASGELTNHRSRFRARAAAAVANCPSAWGIASPVWAIPSGVLWPSQIGECRPTEPSVGARTAL